MSLLEQLLAEYGADIRRDLNKRFIPTFNLGNDTTAADAFNECYQQIRKNEWNKIKLAPKGGISISKTNFRPPMYHVNKWNSGVEIYAVGEGKMLRIQFNHKVFMDEKKNGIYGPQALLEFRRICRKYGIDLDKYKIDNGPEIKKEVPKYMIDVKPQFVGLILENCHHIDFHSSFPAGLANTHPEFLLPLTEIYNKRKEDELMKAVLNLSIGMFHSLGMTNAAWAHLAKDAIADNNKRLADITQRLEESGRVPILWNTDGVWYIGDVYHGEGEGSKLGEWENDHTNCRLRIKSKGAYEFIESGKYYPVIRGLTNWDKVKDRKEWEWGDIFREEANEIAYDWDDDYGLVYKSNTTKKEI